jgi:hypothetical protein
MEEIQHEMHTHLGLEDPEPFVYPNLPPPAIADPWAWYCEYNEAKEATAMKAKMRTPPNEDLSLFSLFGASCQRGRKGFYLARMSLSIFKNLFLDYLRLYVLCLCFSCI